MPEYQSYPPSLWTERPSAVVTIDDLTVTVEVTNGPPDSDGVEISWGDGEIDNAFLDENGAGTVTHTYPEAGDYPVTVRNVHGQIVYSSVVTVTAPEPAPEPEPEPEAPDDTPEPQDVPSEPVEPTEGT